MDKVEKFNEYFKELFFVLSVVYMVLIMSCLILEDAATTEVRSCSQPSATRQSIRRSTTQHNNEGAPKPATRSTTSRVTSNIPPSSYKNFKRASELAAFIDSHEKSTKKPSLSKE